MTLKLPKIKLIELNNEENLYLLKTKINAPIGAYALTLLKYNYYADLIKYLEELLLSYRYVSKYVYIEYPRSVIYEKCLADVLVDLQNNNKPGGLKDIIQESIYQLGFAIALTRAGVRGPHRKVLSKGENTKFVTAMRYVDKNWSGQLY